MAAVALLVDWENLKLALQSAEREYKPAILARDLRIKVMERARQTDPQAFWAEAIAFAPARGLDPQTQVAITENGMTVAATHGSDQAADLTMAIRAMKMYYSADTPVRTFYLVSNDSDFIPLYNELNLGGSVCHMWMVDQSNAARAAQQLERTAYVVELLGIPRPQRAEPVDGEVFLLQCQRLVDQGNHLGSIDAVRQQIVSFGRFDDAEASRAWTGAARARHIDELPGFDPRGKRGKSRRIAYESPAVMQTLGPADMLLHAVAQSRRGVLSRGQALDVVKRPELLDALVRAGCLVEAGDGYLPADPSARYGSIGAGFRIALCYYAATANGQESVGMGQLIKNFWPRFFKVGGNLAEGEAALCADEAKAALNRAIAMRMAARAKHKIPDGREVTGFTIDTEHPLVRTMRERLRVVVTELKNEGVTHADRVRVDDFVRHMASLDKQPWRRAEVDYWVGMLAAQRIVTWKAGELALNRGKLRDVIESW